MSVKTDLLWIAVRFIAKSAILGLAIAGAYLLFVPRNAHITVLPVPDQPNGVMCYVTDRGAISCVQVGVLHT